MFAVLSFSVVTLVALFAVTALLEFVGGNRKKASGIMDGVLAIGIAGIFVAELLGEGGMSAEVPFASQLDAYPSLTSLFLGDLGAFVLECSKLISLMFVISLVSEFVPEGFGGGGTAGKILRSVMLAVIGLGANHFVYAAVAQAPLFGWGLTALQCFLAGAAVLVTPTMILGRLLHLPEGSGVASFLAERLPETKLGKALTMSASNAITFLVMVMLFESQFGSVTSFMRGIPFLLAPIAVIVIMMMGVYSMFKFMFR